MKSLRFSDLYRNISSYLKRNECRDDFTGTRIWLKRWIDNSSEIEKVINRIQDFGATCDCEIISIVKPQVNGKNVLYLLEE